MLHLWTLAILFLTVASNPAPYKRHDYVEKIRADIKSIFADLRTCINEKKVTNEVYQKMLDRINSIKNQPNFDWLLHNARSARFGWARVNFLMTAMKQRLINPTALSTSPIHIPEDHVIPILRRLMIDIHDSSVIAERQGRAHAREKAVAALDSYKLLKQIMKLDDKETDEMERKYIVIINREILVLASHFVEEPEVFNTKTVVPTETDVDHGYELAGQELNQFHDALSDVEKNIIKTIEGVSVVVNNGRCFVYSRLGKWYLHTYTCHLE